MPEISRVGNERCLAPLIETIHPRCYRLVANPSKTFRSLTEEGSIRLRGNSREETRQG